MRYTTHQMGICHMSDSTGTLFFFCLSVCICCMINRCVTTHHTIDQLLCLINTICNFAFNDFLSIKSIHWNFCICCNNNSDCICNFLICHNILGTTGTSCLNLNGISKFCCFFLKCFCCHIRMCNTCRTSCHGKNLYTLRCLNRLLFFGIFLVLCLINHSKELIHTLCFHQIFGKIFIHQQYG